MISQTAEHALRAVLFLARQPATQPVPAARVAEALGAPANYLAKTLHQLAKHGVVVGTRGPTGGFRLAVAPEALTVAEVVEAFDAPVAAPICLLGGRPCTSEDPCAAHARWRAITNETGAALRRTTLADLIGEAAGVEA